MYRSHAHIHMNIPFDVCSCIALLYKTVIPGATLKTVSGLAKNEFSYHPQISLYFDYFHILKPTGVFLLYICVLTALSNYAGCEADCQFMVTHSQ